MKKFFSLLAESFLGEIISFILGLVIAFFTPKVIKYLQNFTKRSVKSLSIEGQWKSSFIEEKKIYSEDVVISQRGELITATMQMNNRVYNFKGEFNNQILVGTYESKSNKKDERGSIVLRYVNESLLSGYCTFIYRNRQIYNSPYILSSQNTQSSQGTYQFCSACVGKFNCCCNDPKIDMPILLPFEANNISVKLRRPIDSFAIKRTDNLYQMKRVENSETRECILFQNNACSIYSMRPSDCRLFPFDFKEFAGEYWLICYNEVCPALPTNMNELETCAYHVKPILELMLPYLSECSSPVFNPRLEKQNYIKLFPINKMRDDDT